MDSDLGGGAQRSSRRKITGSRARHGTSHHEGKAGSGAFRKMSLKDMTERTSWQNMEQCWMEERWRKSRPARSSRNEVRFTRHCSAQLAFTVGWRSGTTLQSSSLSLKTSGSSWRKHWKPRGIARSGVQQRANIVSRGAAGVVRR